MPMYLVTIDCSLSAKTPEQAALEVYRDILSRDLVPVIEVKDKSGNVFTVDMEEFSDPIDDEDNEYDDYGELI